MKTTLYQFSEVIKALDASMDEIDENLAAMELEAKSSGLPFDREAAEQQQVDILTGYFNATREEIGEKLEGIGHYLKALDNQADGWRSESQRLAKLAQVNENRIKRIKDRILWFFREINEVSWVTWAFKFKVQNNGGVQTLSYTKEFNIQDLWKHNKEMCKYVPDETAIRKHLEAGGTLPGVSLLPRGQHIRF